MTDVYQPSVAHSLRECPMRSGGILHQRPFEENRQSMSKNQTYSGMAALSICESLLLALSDAKVLPESEIMGVLKDAAATHENAGSSEADVETHKAAAALIHRIIAGGNSVRRP